MTITIRAQVRWWSCRFNLASNGRQFPARLPRRPAEGGGSVRLPFLLALALVLPAATPKPIRIFDAGIHQTEDGPLAPAGTIFVPGEVIFFSCRLDGYEVSPEKKVAIRYEFSAVDPGGVPVVEPASGKIDAELSPQDKEWKPKIRQTILIPPLAESGTYKARISVKDERSGAVAAAESLFTVKGH